MGTAYQIALENNFRPEKYKPIISRIYSGQVAKTTLDTLYEDLQSLDWNAQESEVKSKHGLKMGYVGGEYLYSQHPFDTSEFLKKAAMYADTVIIEEQVLGTLAYSHNSGRPMPRLDFDYVVNYAIEYLALEPLFYADSSAPICILSPSRLLKKEDVNSPIWQLGRKLLVEYSNELFNKNFKSYENLEDFLESMKSDEEFLNSFDKGKALYTQDGITIDLKYIKGFKKSYEQVYPEPSSTYYETFLFGQHPFRVFDLEYNGRLRTTPITDYRKVWDSLVWLIQHDNEAIAKTVNVKNISKDSLVINALNVEQKLLGKISLDELKELRERGELQDLRDIIGKNVIEMENASDEEFKDVADIVSDNIRRALKKHVVELEQLDKKLKRIKRFSGVSAGSYIITATIGFATSTYLPLALAAGIINGVAFTAQTVKQYLDYRDNFKELQKKPVALLFDAANR